MARECITAFSDVDLRMADGDAPQIDGHFAVYNQPSLPLFGEMREIIRPGAFDRVLSDSGAAESDTRALVNHDWRRVENILGRRSSGTLRLSSDDLGLRALVDAPDTPSHAVLYDLMRRGDVNEASFAFRAAPSGAGIVTERGERMREVAEVEYLQDVSVVTMHPAYQQASAYMRSAFDLTPEQIRASLVAMGTREVSSCYPRKRLAEVRLAEASRNE